MDNNTEKIKERLDIVDLISGYLKLQKSGVNYKANCPFHNEKTPSFYVSPSRQIWHCFGCQKGGDHFTFVQEIEGVEFPEVLRTLAAKAGIELKQFDRSFQNDKTNLLEICDLAAKFFEKQLWESDSGRKALEYLRGRGLTDESIKNFRLGWAHNSWDALTNFLLRKYSTEEIISTGLTIKKEVGSRASYDRFRSRIMFPIADLNGQIVGFTGRIFEDNSRQSAVGGWQSEVASAKYVNTPQTQLYDKSRVLYGLDKAKMSIKRANCCLLVEGNMDVILSHQAGADNTVAVSGTALTEQHLKTVKRYTDNLNLCFDQDAAGLNAMERSIVLSLQRGFNVGVISLDDAQCKDPADYVQKYGKKWRELSLRARPIMEFYFTRAFGAYDALTAIGKKMITEKILPVIKSFSNEVERAHWIAEAALRLRTKEEALMRQMEKIAAAPLVMEVSVTNPSADKKILLRNASNTFLEDYLISLLMAKPELVSLTAKGNEKGEKFSLSVYLVSFLDIFNEYARQTNSPGIMDFLTAQAVEKGIIAPQYLEHLYLQSQELWGASGDCNLEAEFIFALNHLQRKTITAKMADLEFSIRQAEKDRGKQEVESLLGQFQTMTDYLRRLENV